MKENILKQDKVASTISIINQYLRMALHQAQVKNPKFFYFTFKGNTVEKIIDNITIRNAKSALVIDDLGLQIVNRLLQEGVTDITLCLTKFPKELMTTVKYVIQNSFPSIKISIIHYEEISMIKNIDLIISNPAYGAIGADITYKVKDINYKEFINLLPANDYKRNSDKNLFNFQSDMVAINDGFEDAVVTTHLARIHKTKVNDMTLDEFERSQYVDRSLDKYFEENSKRSHYAIDMPKELHRVKDPDITKIIFIAHRDINHKHFPYNKLAQANFINLNLGDYKTVCNKFIMKSAKEKGEIYFLGNCYVFNTAAEKTNMSNFIYSEKGFKFCSKVFTSMNVDGRQTIKNVMPKVDWTHAWTVEEILADYGYTETEITDVMVDLKNFKGMDD